jgi:hypothetical protein
VDLWLVVDPIAPAVGSDDVRFTQTRELRESIRSVTLMSPSMSSSSQAVTVPSPHSRLQAVCVSSIFPQEAYSPPTGFLRRSSSVRLHARHTWWREALTWGFSDLRYSRRLATSSHKVRAADGNRTRVVCLGSRSFAIKLQPLERRHECE